MTGIIFDIQKFALHDGPGIRTVVFLKGCPLRCTWCCNPESQQLQPQLLFKSEKCTHCMLCVDACPNQVHENVVGEHRVHHDNCKRAGACIVVCAYDALRMVGEERNTDDILAEVMRDKHYYDNSGGGITLSGGEPLLQFDFALDLLSKAKTAGLHTCLETSGHVSIEKMKQIAPLVDIFLYDYKITGNDKHVQYTGVKPDLILANLKYLDGANAHIILRCPIIPGINDNPQHFKAIAELKNRFPSIRSVELMAFHNMGNHKAVEAGMQPELVDLNTVSESRAEEWVQQLHRLGCDIAVRG